MTRALEDAQHEAAHLVVGVALGLRPFRVRLDLPDAAGDVVWHGTPWYREAQLIMSAAGVVWERRCGDIVKACFDLKELRCAGVRGNGRLAALERAAWAVLSERHALHTRITRALLERDLNEKDIRAIARGDRTPV